MIGALCHGQKRGVLGPWSGYCDELHDLLRPFVYRRYIDFSAIESLRKMKQLIAQEVRRRQLTDNIKLGAGGIREVEFVVQSFQLIVVAASLHCVSKVYLAPVILVQLRAIGILSG